MNYCAGIELRGQQTARPECAQCRASSISAFAPRRRHRSDTPSIPLGCECCSSNLLPRNFTCRACLRLERIEKCALCCYCQTPARRPSVQKTLCKTPRQRRIRSSATSVATQMRDGLKSGSLATLGPRQRLYHPGRTLPAFRPRLGGLHCPCPASSPSPPTARADHCVAECRWRF